MEGETLKLWYSPYYALMMKKELLNQSQIQNQQTVAESTIGVGRILNVNYFSICYLMFQ